MPRDVCSVRISGLRGIMKPIRHAPYQKPIPLDDGFPNTGFPVVTPIEVPSQMSSPPHTPPPLVHSLGTTPCTSAEPSPSRDKSALPEPESARPSSSGFTSRKCDDSHVRRPANPFILFACDYRKGHKGKNNRELSKEAGALWKVLSESEKQVWRDRAAIIKEKHAEDHPEYRYQPRRREKMGNPRHPQNAYEETPRKATPTALTLPFTPESLSPKMLIWTWRTIGTTASRRIGAKEEDESPLRESLLLPPTLLAAKLITKARDFSELSPVNTLRFAPELTLPHLQFPLPASATPVAGPSSAVAQPVFSAYSTDGSCVPQQGLYFPHQTNEQWENLSNLTSTTWDPSAPTVPHLANSAEHQGLSAAATPIPDDDSLFFDQYEQSVFGGAFSMMDGGASSPFAPLLGDGASLGSA